jgi:glycosyltransferase involved in cell wall biosynthesis
LSHEFTSTAAANRTGRLAMVAYSHYRTDPRCRREATLASAAGWDVQFYALSEDGKRRSDRIEGITLHQLPLARYRGDSSARYFLSYLQFLWSASTAVYRDHRHHSFDVVHVNTMPDFMVLTGLLPRLAGVKVILDIHDVMPEIYMTKFALPAHHWKIRLIRRTEVLSARLAHRILTAEHPKAELLARHGIPAAKIEVLLNLPDEAHFRPEYATSSLATPPGDGDFRLIYHGTVAHRLGLDQAVAALAELGEAVKGVTFQIFGDGDQLPELHRQVQELGLVEQVWFSDGFLPIEEIIPAIRTAHLAVLPTRHTVSTDYMLPTKLLEYLACGVPTIFTATHTVRHYFGDSHPLYLGSPTAAEVENYDEAKELTAALQDSFFNRFRWRDHKQVYLDLLKRLKSN